MNKKAIISSCTITAVVIFILTSIFYHTDAGFRVFSLFGNDDESYDYAKLSHINSLIEESYTGSYNRDNLMDAALFSYVASLGDTYSSYLGEMDFASFNESLSGGYRGIGITVTNTGDKILITEVTPSLPADAAGIRKGDFLIKVNGTPYKGSQMNAATQAIKSTPVGESVLLTVEREAKAMNISVTPDEIKTDYVTSKLIDASIGYINVKTFGNDIGEDFKKEIDALKENGMKKLILDLRSNPGGALEAAVDVGDILLPKGNIISIKDKKGREESFKSDEKELGMPIFLLINEESASASEVIAGALRDYDKAVLIGKKTFGKGVVQSIFDFGDGTGLRLTTAKYYTPSGECIHGKGIEPDIEIDMPEGAEISFGDASKNDPQLLKALEEARK